MEAWLALTILALGIALLVGLAKRTAAKTTADESAGSKREFASLVAGPVRKVLDGDTVIVQSGWERVTLRLDGIDCPEFDQPWGDTARHGLIKLVGGRTVHYESHGTDRFKRTLATLYVWDKVDSVWLNVNLRMVMLGHAWVSPGQFDRLPASRRRELLAVSRWARRKRVGLWAQPSPVPPWQWRNGDRGQ